MSHTCSKAREQENGLSELRGQEEGEPSPNPTDGKRRPSVGESTGSGTDCFADVQVSLSKQAQISEKLGGTWSHWWIPERTPDLNRTLLNEGRVRQVATEPSGEQ